MMFLFVASLVSAQTATPEPYSGSAAGAAVTLEKLVYFVGEDGTAVPVNAGDYFVEQAGEKAIRLIPASGDSVIVAAQPGTHEEDLQEDLAVAVSWEEDEFHIVLHMRDAASLDARGTFSGISTRAVRTSFSLQKYRTQLSKQVQFKRTNLSTYFARPAYRVWTGYCENIY